MCAGLGYGEMACHRFAIKAPSSGFLEVSLSGAAFEFDTDVVNPDGTFALYFASVRTPIKLEFPVTDALTSKYASPVPGHQGSSDDRDGKGTGALRKQVCCGTPFGEERS